MRLVIQRVSHASARVDGTTVGAIGPGLLVLIGVERGDNAAEAVRLAQKTAELRIFDDDAGRFDQSLIETSGEALVVSQFTLLADIRKGRRPSFTGAAPPEAAEPLVEAYAAALQSYGTRVARGHFGAHMTVELENDGPVTILIDSSDLNTPRRA